MDRCIDAHSCVSFFPIQQPGQFDGLLPMYVYHILFLTRLLTRSYPYPVPGYREDQRIREHLESRYIFFRAFLPPFFDTLFNNRKCRAR